MIKRAADWYIEKCREGIEMLCELWNYREDGHGRLQAFLSDLDQFWMRGCLIVFFFRGTSDYGFGCSGCDLNED